MIFEYILIQFMLQQHAVGPIGNSILYISSQLYTFHYILALLHGINNNLKMPYTLCI